MPAIAGMTIPQFISTDKALTLRFMPGKLLPPLK